MIEEIYKTMPADYYARQMRTPGLRGVWFRKRQLVVRGLVKKYCRGGRILDLGCGNSLWNNNGIPVIGIDLCEQMLGYNRTEFQSFFPLKADAGTTLPLKNASVDAVIITEVLEHFPLCAGIVTEIERVLKKDGILIVSVPYSRFPGVWGYIFPLWCLFKWLRFRDQYYRNNCGHISAFNFRTLHGLLRRFTVLENRHVAYLTLFTVARKV